MAKPDCYSCKWRGNLPGSAHSCCRHPSVQGAKNDPLLNVLAIFASVGRTPPMQINTKQLNVIGDPHGVRMGWFNWPWNFDPTWLENCDGWEIKDVSQKGKKES